MKTKWEVEIGNKKNHKIEGALWGLLFIGAAVLIILSQLGYSFFLGGLAWYDYLILAFCIYGIINGIAKKELFELGFSLGIGYYILSSPLEMPHVSFWPLMLAILALCVGLNMILPDSFKRKSKSVCIDGDEWIDVDEDGYEDEDVTVFKDTMGGSNETVVSGDFVFSNSSRYIRSQDFKAYNGDAVFSHLRLYFNNANLHEGVGSVGGDCVFSTVEVFVPANWNVVNRGSAVLSHRDLDDFHDADAPTLYIDGDFVFSTLKIRRV